MISLLTRGLFRNVLLCFTSHWFNQGLSFWKMIQTFCRLVSFWIVLFQGVSAASLRFSTWPSPLVGPWIPFFLSPQPHRFLETAQLFIYCLGIDKPKEKSGWDSCFSDCRSWSLPAECTWLMGLLCSQWQLLANCFPRVKFVEEW